MDSGASQKRLFLIGAGDFGREVESWLNLLPDFDKEWKIIGYLDDNEHALGNYPSDYQIVGKPLTYDFCAGDYVLLCISNPVVKENIVKQLANKKVGFFTYVAPYSIIGKFSNIGLGCIICPHVVITTNVNIGKFSIINIGSQIGHDCKIGDFSSIMSNVDLGGKVVLGDRVYMGTNSTVIPGRSIAENIKIGAGAVVIRSLKKHGTYFGNPARLVS